MRICIDSNQFIFGLSCADAAYRPIALGGLWKNENIDDKDIDEVRHEMWKSLEDRELWYQCPTS